MIKEKWNNFLERLSGLLGIDLFYVVQGGFWTIGPLVITAVGGTLLTIVLTRALGQTSYGQYRFVLSIIPFAVLLSMPGMDLAVIQSISRGKTGSFRRGLLTRWKWSFLGVIFLLLSAGYLYFIRESNTWIYLVIAAVFFPFSEGLSIFRSYYTGKKLFEKLGKAEVLLTVSSITLQIIVGWLYPSVFLVLLTYFFAHAVVNLWHSKKAYFSTLSYEGDTSLYSFGKKLSLIGVLSTATAHLDSLIIAYLLGFQQLAIYSIALTIPEAVKGFVKAFRSVMLPKASITSEKGIKDFLVGKAGLFFVSGLSLAGVLWALLPWAIPLLFTGEYTAAVFPSQLLSLSLLLVPLLVFLSTYFHAHKLSKHIFVFTLIQFIFGVGLVVLLVPLFGVVGGILGILGRRIVGAVYGLTVLGRS